MGMVMKDVGDMPWDERNAVHQSHIHRGHGGAYKAVPCTKINAFFLGNTEISAVFGFPGFCTHELKAGE